MRDRHSAVVIFARVPHVGRVKTRLAAGIGDAAALSAYMMLADLVVRSVATSSTYMVSVAYTPPSGEGAMRAWLGASMTLVPQTEGDLGARMVAAIDDAFSTGAHRVVVIGTDCPDVTVAVIEDAFARLAAADVVIGPATDGGYYLIGMSRLHAGLFDRIPWSSADTLRVTLDRAATLSLSVNLLDERADIDTAEDWHAWLARSATGDSGALHGMM